MNKSTIQARLARYSWHQRWEVSDGIHTPGENPVNTLLDLAKVPLDLSGRRVLDIGAYNACFSFECERRGAAEVVAVDVQDPEKTGVTELARILDFKVRYVRRSVYALDPRSLDTFDLILFFGVLYHLRYPLLAIDRLRSVATRDVYVETHLLTARRALRGPRWLSTILSGGLKALPTPVWRQYAARELRARDATNVFDPSPTAVIEAFDSVGFSTRLSNLWKHGARGSFLATVQGEMPARIQAELGGLSMRED